MAELNDVCSVGHRSSVSISTLENFYFYSRKIWIIDFSFHSRNSRPEFQISHSTLEIRDQNFTFLFLLSKFEIRILYFSFYSRNSRPEFQISLSTLEIRDQNLKFLLLLSKFEIRISNFSFYSRNSRSEFQISLSTLEFTFLTLVNACSVWRKNYQVPRCSFNEINQSQRDNQQR